MARAAKKQPSPSAFPFEEQGRNSEDLAVVVIVVVCVYLVGEVCVVGRCVCGGGGVCVVGSVCGGEVYVWWGRRV